MILLKNTDSENRKQGVDGISAKNSGNPLHHWVLMELGQGLTAKPVFWGLTNRLTAGLTNLPEPLSIKGCRAVNQVDENSTTPIVNLPPPVRGG